MALDGLRPSSNRGAEFKDLEKALKEGRRYPRESQGLPFGREAEYRIETVTEGGFSNASWAAFRKSSTSELPANVLLPLADRVQFPFTYTDSE
jgi:hypothetical protein